MNKNRKMLKIILATYIVFLVVLLALILPTVIKVFSYELIENIGVEAIIIAFFFLVTFISVLIFMLVTLYNRDKQYEHNKENTIYLDEERSYLESQINEINRKLVATDERWKEAYHLIISSQTKQSDLTGRISAEKFLEGFGIEMSDIKVQGNLAFVLTPFHSEFEYTYHIISDVCSKTKLTAVRGNETFIKNDILKHIVSHIVKSRVVIANLDGRNPNVFYELGIAHALNKPTILLANVDTQIPVDINNQYLILYKNEEELREELTDALLKVLATNN